MSQSTFVVDAQSRADVGKGASRRLRKLNDQIPAIVYGGKEAPAKITVDHKKMCHALENEAFYSKLLTLNLDSKKQKVVLKDLQRHPYKSAVLHVDFLRVSDDDVLTMHVPIHYINESACPGVKAGGIINHLEIDLEVKCKAKFLPEFIEIDLANLELDSSIHAAELKLPENVELTCLLHENNLSLVNVHLPRAGKIEDEESANQSAEVEATSQKSADNADAKK